ncbi:MAG TPA: flagellar hook assembly protein FlgD [Pararhizobium sp.]|jgi:flagellar basal-body rod modification protein FlgD|nr:flagellar hook assembly protein FlgD [Pararhizobium sp.]
MALDATTGVNAQTQTQSNSQSSQAASALNVDYNTFLKLLIAQMKNQDPTDPMDATQQVAQLATFSQVEQTIQVNKNLENLIASSALSQAGSVIGRTLTSADGSTTGTVEQVRVNSDGITALLDNGKEIDVTAGVTIQ